MTPVDDDGTLDFRLRHRNSDLDNPGNSEFMNEGVRMTFEENCVESEQVRPALDRIIEAENTWEKPTGAVA